MDINNLPAGRELDALIAEKVFGFTGIGYYKPTKLHGLHLDYELAASYEEALKVTQEMWDREDVGCVDLCHWKAGWGPLFVPESSTDIAAAWKVVEELSRRGFSCHIEWYAGTAEGVFTYWTGAKFCNAHALGDTAPLAICRAALKAVNGA